MPGVWVVSCWLCWVTAGEPGLPAGLQAAAMKQATAVQIEADKINEKVFFIFFPQFI